MIEIAPQDVARAFGQQWTENKIDSGAEKFFLTKEELFGEKKWFILDQNRRILKRTRSDIALARILGVDSTNVERGYETWLNLTSK